MRRPVERWKERTCYATTQHVITDHHGTWTDLKFYSVDTVVIDEHGGDRTRTLRQWESRYIIKLRTKIPFGLNFEEELYVNL